MAPKLLTNKTVVLIEDNAFLSNVITKKLEYHGAEVIVYTNGLEGLAGVRKEQPDLVLLDITMPIMNGYEVLQVMHAEKITDKTPVIVISNSGKPVEIEKVKQLGVKDYLVKANFEPGEVIDKVFVAMGIDAKPDKDVVDKAAEAGVKVMVIEDDPLLRNILSVKLSKSECPHMFSSDGNEAVDLIRQYGPSVIILDMMLPGRSGLEILTELKADPELKEIPVIIFSNKDEEDEKAKTLELGALEYNVKAMTDLPSFVEKIKKLAQKKS